MLDPFFFLKALGYCREPPLSDSQPQWWVVENSQPPPMGYPYSNNPYGPPTSAPGVAAYTDVAYLRELSRNRPLPPPFPPNWGGAPMADPGHPPCVLPMNGHNMSPVPIGNIGRVYPANNGLHPLRRPGLQRDLRQRNLGWRPTAQLRGNVTPPNSSPPKLGREPMRSNVVVYESETELRCGDDSGYTENPTFAGSSQIRRSGSFAFNLHTPSQLASQIVVDRARHPHGRAHPDRAWPPMASIAKGYPGAQMNIHRDANSNYKELHTPDREASDMMTSQPPDETTQAFKIQPTRLFLTGPKGQQATPDQQTRASSLEHIS